MFSCLPLWRRRSSPQSRPWCGGSGRAKAAAATAPPAPAAPETAKNRNVLRQKEPPGLDRSGDFVYIIPVKGNDGELRTAENVRSEPGAVGARRRCGAENHSRAARQTAVSADERSVSGDGFPPLWGSAWCVREKVVQRAKLVLLRDGLFCISSAKFDTDGGIYEKT